MRRERERKKRENERKSVECELLTNFLLDYYVLTTATEEAAAITSLLPESIFGVKSERTFTRRSSSETMNTDNCCCCSCNSSGRRKDEDEEDGDEVL